MGKNGVAMLELEDIQHFLLTRPRAMAARYGFLCFRRPEVGRAWLAGIIDRVGTGRAMSGAGQLDARWVTVAFTWNGLRALGVDEASLAMTTAPEPEATVRQYVDAFNKRFSCAAKTT
jgi:hypothetical protein